MIQKTQLGKRDGYVAEFIKSCLLGGERAGIELSSLFFECSIKGNSILFKVNEKSGPSVSFLYRTNQEKNNIIELVRGLKNDEVNIFRNLPDSEIEMEKKVVYNGQEFSLLPFLMDDGYKEKQVGLTHEDMIINLIYDINGITTYLCIPSAISYYEGDESLGGYYKKNGNSGTSRIAIWKKLYYDKAKIPTGYTPKTARTNRPKQETQTIENQPKKVLKSNNKSLLLEELKLFVKDDEISKGNNSENEDSFILVDYSEKAYAAFFDKYVPYSAVDYYKKQSIGKWFYPNKDNRQYGKYNEKGGIIFKKSAIDAEFGGIEGLKRDLMKRI